MEALLAAIRLGRADLRTTLVCQNSHTLADVWSTAEGPVFAGRVTFDQAELYADLFGEDAPDLAGARRRASELEVRFVRDLGDDFEVWCRCRRVVTTRAALEQATEQRRTETRSSRRRVVLA